MIISGRRVSSYREVEESVGLLDEDSNNDTDDEVVCINGFDVIAPISLQVCTKYRFSLLKRKAGVTFLIITKTSNFRPKFVQK